MATSSALQLLRQDMHVSASEIRTYLGCPLQHHYRYVERRPAERMSIALPFGKAIHSALERYYDSLRQEKPGNLPVLQEIFSESLRFSVREAKAPLLYKKDMPDLDSAIVMGQAMLEAFFKQVDLTGFKVLAVEHPISAPLISPEGEDLDIQLLGVIDLLLEDAEGNIAVIDHKTARNGYSEADLEKDLQLGAYAYLLFAEGTVDSSQPLHCRFDVLRKLKNPRLEQYHTTRTARDAARFAGTAEQVLRGMERRIFYPTRSWLCTDCGFREACSRWRIHPAQSH